ncbi:hypothetical protein HYH03_009233 [Edaphochlamys debaryana]|uniref:SAM domain-containing protein n=1 Tax=Edaphochlamys debaryana TaxID=47281 RepID=A0A835XWT8_9CHLO|nr:hypothetical protein HYH03_009233 [Edaphochlamys debaryana]|eukprot:KAG2492572.1 hypothetical protein HYH03_009233 [Edaphochlamys debaryana]
MPNVDKWTNADVVAFLRTSGMEGLVEKFEEHEVTGIDILLLDEEELRSMLQITRLQAVKVKKLAEAANINDDADDEAVEAAAQQLEAVSLDTGGEIPHISANPDDLGTVEEQAEIQRAVSIRVHAAPAPAMGQPAAPALPAGTAALQLDEGTVHRYQTSMHSIMTLEGEGVAQALPAARTRLDVARKQLKMQEEKFESLRSEEAKRSQKLAELQEGKWYPGKYLFGKAKREAKLERNTQKAEGVSAKVRAVGAALEELHVRVGRETKTVNDLVAKCAQLDEAKAFCAALLQSAFAGGAVGDARENALETEVGMLGPKLEEVRRYKTVYAQAHEHIKGAKQALAQAADLLQRASGLATVDVMSNVFRPMPMRNSMGGVMVDVIKRQQWGQGLQLCRVAADMAIRARSMVPDMPRVKVEKLQQLRMGFGMMDVVFDNIISDMIAARKIRDALAKVRDCLEDVAEGERWLRGWLQNRIDQDLRGLEAQLATRRSELHAHRTHLLNEWIRARAAGATAEAPQRPPVAVGMPVPNPAYAQGYIL